MWECRFGRLEGGSLKMKSRQEFKIAQLTSFVSLRERRTTKASYEFGYWPKTRSKGDIFSYLLSLFIHNSFGLYFTLVVLLTHPPVNS